MIKELKKQIEFLKENQDKVQCFYGLITDLNVRRAWKNNLIRFSSGDRDALKAGAVEIMHPTVDSYTRINSERLIWDFKKVMRR